MLGQVEDRVPFAGELAQDLAVIVFLVNEEGIALARYLQKLVIGVEIGIVLSLADDHAFTLGAAYVLSPGHFKVGKQFFGAGTNIQHPAAPTMHSRRVDLKAERAVRCQPVIYSRVIVSYIWFQAQDYRPLFASKYVGLFKQSAQRW